MAESETEAAQLASENHNDYQWEFVGLVEFDAQIHITLDAEGCEVEATEIRDF